MPGYDGVIADLRHNPRTWLVTGAAGFIGSHLVETLLGAEQRVVGLDNFSTGHRHNLDQVADIVGDTHWNNFALIEGDIADLDTCMRATNGVDIVLHQAALGSVPRSIADPLNTHRSNIDGFVNMLQASHLNKVKRFVYAASSSTYGDHPDLPKQEDVIGAPLSPYAVTKYVNELYASVYSRCFELETNGLRYFNVFGPRQDPNGAYAAVIPKWFQQLRSGTACRINGDGETSRDFCFVANAVQANILAATTENPTALNTVYNVAVGERTSLNQLHDCIKALLAEHAPGISALTPEYGPFREGDVRHSQADISRARELLGFQPSHDIHRGLKVTSDWFMESASQSKESL